MNRTPWYYALFFLIGAVFALLVYKAFFVPPTVVTVPTSNSTATTAPVTNTPVATTPGTAVTQTPVQQPVKAVVNGPKVYTNAEYKFSFEYPANVTVQKSSNTMDRAMSSYTVINPATPAWENIEGGPAMIFVNVYDRGNKTLIQWAKDNVNVTNFSDEVKYTSKMINGMESISYTVEGLGTFEYTLIRSGNYIFGVDYSYITNDPVVRAAYVKLTGTFKVN